MVFLDAANSVALERAAPLVTRTITVEACMATVAARLGVLRLIDPFALRREPTDAAARAVSRLYRVEPMATLCGIVRGIQTTLAKFRAAPPLGADVPSRFSLRKPTNDWGRRALPRRPATSP
jgi:hypothetical protein